MMGEDYEPIESTPDMDKKTRKVQALKKECLICLEVRADAVIMNCGHGGICFDCGSKLS